MRFLRGAGPSCVAARKHQQGIGEIKQCLPPAIVGYRLHGGQGTGFGLPDHQGHAQPARQNQQCRVRQQRQQIRQRRPVCLRCAVGPGARQGQSYIERIYVQLAQTVAAQLRCIKRGGRVGLKRRTQGRIDIANMRLVKAAIVIDLAHPRLQTRQHLVLQGFRTMQLVQKIGLASVLTKHRALAIKHVQHLRRAIEGNRANQVDARSLVWMSTGNSAKSQRPDHQFDAPETLAGCCIRAVKNMLHIVVGRLAQRPLEPGLQCVFEHLGR